MEYIKNAPASTLYWFQLNALSEIKYELRSDNKTSGVFCTYSDDTGSAISADGQWTIRYYDCDNALRIESCDGAVIAVCDRNPKSKLNRSKTEMFDDRDPRKQTAVVEFSNGHRFYLGWSAIYDDRGTDALLSFAAANKWWLLTLSEKLRVELGQRAKNLPEASLLAVLGLIRQHA